MKTLSKVNKDKFQNRKVILFSLDYLKITGTHQGALFLSQVIYWQEKNKNKKFYKFKAPCKHSYYKKDDSWVEELGLSSKQIAKILKNIGFNTFRNRDFKDFETKKANALIWYHNDSKNLTWYEINFDLLNQKLDNYYNLNGIQEPTAPEPIINDSAEEIFIDTSEDDKLHQKDTDIVNGITKQEAFKTYENYYKYIEIEKILKKPTNDWTPKDFVIYFYVGMANIKRKNLCFPSWIKDNRTLSSLMEKYEPEYLKDLIYTFVMCNIEINKEYKNKLTLDLTSLTTDWKVSAIEKYIELANKKRRNKNLTPAQKLAKESDKIAREVCEVLG